jgi:hypothetical protein
MFNWLHKNKIIKNKTNGVEDNMSTIHCSIGEFICESCSTLNSNPRLMEIDPDDESKGSLIYCSTCEAYRKWT